MVLFEIPLVRGRVVNRVRALFEIKRNPKTASVEGDSIRSLGKAIRKPGYLFQFGEIGNFLRYCGKCAKNENTNQGDYVFSFHIMFFTSGLIAGCKTYSHSIVLGGFEDIS